MYALLLFKAAPKPSCIVLQITSALVLALMVGCTQSDEQSEASKLAGVSSVTHYTGEGETVADAKKAERKVAAVSALGATRYHLKPKDFVAMGVAIFVVIYLRRRRGQ